jgi:hypothetical protein
MNNFFRKFFIDESNNLSYKRALIIFATPLILTVFMVLLLVIPVTRDYGFHLIGENKPVEMLTFIFLLFGGVFGVWFSLKVYKYNGYKLVASFYMVFAVFLIIVGMEEISWGQQLLKFNTPDSWKEINVQGETTLHNLGFMQNFNDNLHFIFGFAGLISLFLKKNIYFKIISSSLILSSWFLIITIHSFVDILLDSIEIRPFLDFTIERLNEFIELLIGMSAFLYLWLNKRRFDKSQLVLHGINNAE